MISQTEVNSFLNLEAGLSDSPSLPTYVYLGLSSSEPDHATGKVEGEPTAESYERKIVGGSSASTLQSFSAASGGIITNSKEIQMKTAREAWGTMKYWFLAKSAGGNATIWGLIKDTDGNEGITIDANTVPTFYEGQLQASIDVPLS